MKIPTTCYGRIAPRSGLAWKKHIDVGAGVIDADYRGNVGVVLFNHGKEDMEALCSFNILFLLPSFKLVSLPSLRISSNLKHPKQVFF